MYTKYTREFSREDVICVTYTLDDINTHLREK